MTHTDSHDASPRETRFTVDRLEGAIAVLVPTDHHSPHRPEEVPWARLPATCRAEGAVLRVMHDGAGHWAWDAAVRDAAVEQALRADLGRRLKRLGATDAGRDVVL